jgi:hypothetical protein
MESYSSTSIDKIMSGVLISLNDIILTKNKIYSQLTIDISGIKNYNATVIISSGNYNIKQPISFHNGEPIINKFGIPLLLTLIYPKLNAGIILHNYEKVQVGKFELPLVVNFTFR